MCVYNYVPTPTLHAAVSVLSVHHSTTRNTPWTRPAARHRTRLLRTSPGNDPSTSLSRWLLRRSRDPDILFPSVLFVSFFLVFRVFVTLFLFLRYSSLLYHIVRVIGSKVNRSKVIFSSRSLSPVPRERSVSCLSPFFYSSELFFSRYTFSFFFASLSVYFSLSLSLLYFAESFYKFEKVDVRMVERTIDGNWSAMHSTVGELNRTCRSASSN